MVTHADRKLGTNFFLLVMNIWQSLPAEVTDQQQGIQQAYNAYVTYISDRCKGFRDRGWKINICNHDPNNIREERYPIHPYFELDERDTLFIHPYEFVYTLRDSPKGIIFGCFLKEQVVTMYKRVKPINAETYIAPTLCFPQKWGYDKKNTDDEFHRDITISDYIYI